MPSPFPGMDPYLEGNGWTSFCLHFSVEIARCLAPEIRPKYVVLCDKRFVTVSPEGNGESPAPTVPEKIPHVSIEVRSVEGRKLVTAIEMLTPTNKGRGRDEYLARRDQHLSGTAHLLELDFLRTGSRIPIPGTLPEDSYFAMLSRATRRNEIAFWPIQMRDRLPVVTVPLLPDDADVPLDLQSVSDTLFDIFRFDLSIDYREPPSVPLAPDDSRWADDLLRAAGLRG